MTEATWTRNLVHATWDGSNVCDGRYGGPAVSPRFNPESVSCPQCRQMSNLGTCDFPIFNGNENDPEYAYCGYMPNHAGDHGAWIK